MNMRTFDNVVLVLIAFTLGVLIGQDVPNWYIVAVVSTLMVFYILLMLLDLKGQRDRKIRTAYFNDKYNHHDDDIPF
jgi:uncharacterized membrane protein YcaP (DUF421 family)